MKILYPWIPNYRLNYPNSRIQGGAEDVCLRVLDALSDHEVDLLIPSDSVARGHFNTIQGDYVSKESGGKVPRLRYTETLIDLAPSYDLVILNDNFLSLSQKVRDKVFSVLAPRTLVIQHDPAEIYLRGYHLAKFQMHQALVEYGAKIAYVSPLMQREIQRASKSFDKNPSREASLPFDPELNDRWVWFDIKEVNSLTNAGIKPCDGHWVIIGRSAPSKKILNGVKSFLRSNKERLHIFSKSTTDREDEMVEIRQIASDHGERVQLFEDASRAEIFDSLLSSEGFIFPSQSESLGLVSFEAMSSGCPVVYTVENPRVHLEHSGGSIWVDRRTSKKYAEAIDSVTWNDKQRQEQWEFCQREWSHTKFKERVEDLIVSFC